jgi:hypothetical protein
MSCQTEPQYGGEGIVGVCGLLELYTYIIIIILYMGIYIILSNITVKSYVHLG